MRVVSVANTVHLLFVTIDNYNAPQALTSKKDWFHETISREVPLFCIPSSCIIDFDNLFTCNAVTNTLGHNINLVILCCILHPLFAGHTRTASN